MANNPEISRQLDPDLTAIRLKWLPSIDLSARIRSFLNPETLAVMAKRKTRIPIFSRQIAYLNLAPTADDCPTPLMKKESTYEREVSKAFEHIFDLQKGAGIEQYEDGTLELSFNISPFDRARNHIVAPPLYQFLPTTSPIEVYTRFPSRNVVADEIVFNRAKSHLLSGMGLGLLEQDDPNAPANMNLHSVEVYRRDPIPRIGTAPDAHALDSNPNRNT
jgi:hypothetical protein